MIRPSLATLFAVVAFCPLAEAAGLIAPVGFTASPTIEFIAPPPSVVPGSFEVDTSIFMFLEQSELTLQGHTPVDLINPAAGQGSKLPPLTVVDVYLLHFDPMWPPEPDPNEPPPMPPFDGVPISGSVTFDLPIAGLQVAPSTIFDAVNLRHPAVEYPLGPTGLELAPNAPSAIADAFVWSDDHLTLSLDLSATSNIDQVRVLVLRRVAPEPASVALLAVLAALAAGRRERATSPRAGRGGASPLL